MRHLIPNGLDVSCGDDGTFSNGHIFSKEYSFSKHSFGKERLMWRHKCQLCGMERNYPDSFSNDRAKEMNCQQYLEHCIKDIIV